MKSIDLNSKLINSYLELLKNLDPGNKLDLISKLAQSIKSDFKSKKNTFEKSFGAWDSKDDAHTLAKSIRASRTFKRDIEEL